MDLLKGYGRHAPLARLIPVLMLVAVAYLAGFTGFVLWPSLHQLMDLRAQAAAAEQAALTAEQVLRSVQETAAGRQRLAQQVRSAESRLLAVTDLAGLAARLAGHAQEAGAVLTGIQFGEYHPLQEAGAGRPAQGAEEGGRSGDGAEPSGPGVADQGSGGGGGGGAAAGDERGTAGTGDAGDAVAAGSSEAAYGSVAFTATVQGSWQGLQAWFQRVAQREPSVWFDRVEVRQGDGGTYRAHVTGRIWVKGRAPAEVTAAVQP